MYPKLYRAYNAIAAFAKFHDVNVTNWHHSHVKKTSATEPLKDTLFYIEVQKAGFVAAELGDFYVVICSKGAVANTQRFHRLKGLADTIGDAIFVIEEENPTKINALLDKSENFRKMLLPTFVNSPLNSVYAPKIKVVKEVPFPRKHIPQIHYQDPVAVWMRLNIGETIMIKNKNPYSGYDICYRLVIN